ncbi:MAG TPA: hypothetical protein ENI49_03795 [Thermoplasmatales archaeon]|nr:hypothetical protein [Thermoplasmatales archaeon]
MLQQLLELVRRKNILRWNLKRVEVKSIAVILYYAGISFRKTSKFLKDFEKFSHKSLKLWYHKIANLFASTRKDKRCVAIR